MRKTHDPDVLSIAIAEPSRRAILENLRFGKKSVTELVQATHLKQPNVSNHLAKMREQGIVRAERIGRQVYYSISMPLADVLLRMHEFVSNPVASAVSELQPYISASSQEQYVAASQKGLHQQSHLQHSQEESIKEKQEGLTNEPHVYTAQQSSASTNGATPLTEWEDSYFNCIMEGREDQAATLVNGMLSQGFDMQTIYVEIFQHAINRVGTLYQQGLTDEAHEHMASAITERMMARVALFNTPVVRASRRVILGCVAENWHVLGIRMLSDGLRAVGWETLFLGANVPTASFVAIVTTMNPDLVVISSSMEDQVEELRNLLGQLRNSQADKKFVIALGGHLIQSHPELVPLQKGDITATDLPGFLAEIKTRFGETPSV